MKKRQKAYDDDMGLTPADMPVGAIQDLGDKIVTPLPREFPIGFDLRSADERKKPNGPGKRKRMRTGGSNR